VLFLILMHDQSTMKPSVTLPEGQGEGSYLYGASFFKEHSLPSTPPQITRRSHRNRMQFLQMAAWWRGSLTLLSLLISKPVCAPNSLLHYHLPYVLP